MNSGIYCGQVRHRRFSPKQHAFSYSMYMLALDLDELDLVATTSHLFSLKKFAPISFFQDDYIKGEPGNLKQRIASKVTQLGGNWDGTKVTFMGQCRNFGIYFSPANFFFCYDQDNVCTTMLVEVSNTPWLERHYYVVDISKQQRMDKTFHVSPFMDLDMQYVWRVKAPQEKVLIHIENHKSEKVFDATVALSRCEFSRRNMLKTWLSTPAMTLKVVVGIYWQALKLFAKRIPFIAHPNARG
ncbi:DUF1365 domain-containing protein [Pseudoalteromonas spongiae]|uniref:DUF1365 domain-containing protein n=1 Tax=Pseudoalteromonas spongiae TaxID=298657 RepID=UPI0018E28426|nr:DUF1365 domain-containing protein [Pseudoalteromonas spongiae]